MLLYLFRLGPNMLSLIGRVYHMEHGFQFDKLLVGITYRYLKYIHIRMCWVYGSYYYYEYKVKRSYRKAFDSDLQKRLHFIEKSFFQ